MVQTRKFCSVQAVGRTWQGRRSLPSLSGSQKKELAIKLQKINVHCQVSVLHGNVPILTYTTSINAEKREHYTCGLVELISFLKRVESNGDAKKAEGGGACGTYRQVGCLRTFRWLCRM